MKAPSTNYAPINGINMYYEIHGQGKPLVLIHGGGSTIQTTFGNILPLLAEKFEVIAVELQAHGHTSDRNAPETFVQDANDVAALIRYLKIDKASFFGFSNGGQTTMQLGISHPELVDKLIIASAFYKRSGAFNGFFDMMDHATIDNMPEYLKEAFKKINPDPEALMNMFNKDRNRMINFKDWKDEELKSIKAPTLIIMGDQDVATPEHAVEMSRLISNSQLLIVPGNHGSYMGEGLSANQSSKIPSFTIAVIEEFLNA